MGAMEKRTRVTPPMTTRIRWRPTIRSMRWEMSRRLKGGVSYNNQHLSDEDEGNEEGSEGRRRKDGEGMSDNVFRKKGRLQ